MGKAAIADVTLHRVKSTESKMDRIEAYRLLTREMELLEAKAASSALHDDYSVSKELGGEVDGVLYTIDLRVERDTNGSRTLFGSIHDNNSAKFSMLEERKSLA
ncbi:MAG: hypothetical protein ACU0GG_21120 [Paracoccaceae bacterium]